MDPAAAALAQAQGSINSRFVSQDAVDEAKAKQAEEWKAAYARIGQSPPPQEPDEAYDGRTLYERLNAQKDSKREEWDEKMKLGNQYRGLQTEELNFLADKAKERKEAERKLEEKESAEVREFREALAAKNAASLAAAGPSNPPSVVKKVPPKPVKKNVKSLLKGVVVKKKPKPVTPKTEAVEIESKGVKRVAETEEGDDGKRQKVETDE
ncbi:hypothetical protein P7C73_g2122, partial [Tremellales sp. Uapishka_1]